MSLGVIGCLWVLLDVVECCWMLLDAAGCCWMLLDAGCCWMVLDAAGCCWIDILGTHTGSHTKCLGKVSIHPLQSLGGDSALEFMVKEVGGTCAGWRHCTSIGCVCVRPHTRHYGPTGSVARDTGKRACVGHSPVRVTGRCTSVHVGDGQGRAEGHCNDVGQFGVWNAGKHLVVHQDMTVATPRGAS